ncbi:collagen-like protein [Pediococcus sp. EKM202D]|uniref:collagen-like triple helix repeat-containing protein n=1 Tax=unclassified Pediococcus TaxID=554805 RepID=UPI00142DEEB2|nr:MULTISPECIES: collagen-like protein [unclassified Pediococcus]KAF5440748.1 collagen-like protein [Pediococcus sp. EKM202D]KAF5441688.1 collagen-like protein [Pediococcus sp. EKM201D]
MAHTANEWKTGDTITATKLNAIENDLAAVGNGEQGPKGDAGATGPAGPTGPKGDKGADGATGASVKAIELELTNGSVTGGTATLTDDSTVSITVTTK